MLAANPLVCITGPTNIRLNCQPRFKRTTVDISDNYSCFTRDQFGAQIIWMTTQSSR